MDKILSRFDMGGFHRECLGGGADCRELLSRSGALSPTRSDIGLPGISRMLKRAAAPEAHAVLVERQNRATDRAADQGAWMSSTARSRLRMTPRWRPISSRPLAGIRTAPKPLGLSVLRPWRSRPAVKSRVLMPQGPCPSTNGGARRRGARVQRGRPGLTGTQSRPTLVQPATPLMVAVCTINRSRR